MESILKLVDIYEAADDMALSDFYMESGMNISDIGDRIVKTIQKLIENLKKFAEKTKVAFESLKIKSLLTSEAVKSGLIIRWNCDDKYIAKTMFAIIKAENSIISDIRKLHDKCVNGKMDPDDCYQKILERRDKFDKFVEDLSVKALNHFNTVNDKQLSSIAIGAQLDKMYEIQMNAIEQSKKYCLDEMERLQKESTALYKAQQLALKAGNTAKKAGAAIANTVKKGGKVTYEALASLKSKIASVLGGIHRSSTTKITGIGKIKKLVSDFLTKLKSGGSKKQENPSGKKGKAYKEDAEIYEALGIDASYFEESSEEIFGKIDSSIESMGDDLSDTNTSFQMYEESANEYIDQLLNGIDEGLDGTSDLDTLINEL